MRPGLRRLDSVCHRPSILRGGSTGGGHDPRAGHDPGRSVQRSERCRAGRAPTGGRVGDARICRLAMRPPIVDRAEGRPVSLSTSATRGAFCKSGFGTRHGTAAADR